MSHTKLYYKFTPSDSMSKKKMSKFAIIGDVHFCADELRELLEKISPDRCIVFTGNFSDKGPKIKETVEILRKLQDEGRFYSVIGPIEQMYLNEHNDGSDGRRNDYSTTRRLLKHVNLYDNFLNLLMDCKNRLTFGRLTVIGAGTSYVPADGMIVVRGNKPVKEVQVKMLADGVTEYNIDTGCVFPGGKLTALLYPELETIQVFNKDKYYPPSIEYVQNFYANTK